MLREVGSARRPQPQRLHLGLETASLFPGLPDALVFRRRRVGLGVVVDTSLGR